LLRQQNTVALLTSQIIPQKFPKVKRFSKKFQARTNPFAKAKSGGGVCIREKYFTASEPAAVA
jgi:hypothetical protein